MPPPATNLSKASHCVHTFHTQYRWLYLASACKELLLHNGADPASFRVICKRPCDLTLASSTPSSDPQHDVSSSSSSVPTVCNLVVCCGLLEDGLLTSGIVPAVTHALLHLALPDAVVIPASITIMCQVCRGVNGGRRKGPGGRGKC